MSSSSSNTLIVLGLLVLMALTAWLTLVLRRKVAAAVLQARATRGRAGEAEAEKLLEARGYTILDAQVTQESGLYVEGEWRAVKVRADYLAEKAGKTFVVEVKTGAVAPDPASAATRRQLLEYHHVFDADGVILADMERRELLRIDFGPPPASETSEESLEPPPSWRAPFLGGLIVGLCLAMALIWTLR